MRLIQIVLAWMVAVLVAAGLGSIIQSQFNLAALGRLGFPVAPGERLAVSLHDLGSFAPLYAILVAIALAIGLAVSGTLARFWPRRRSGLHALAGLCALAALFALMNQLLPATLIAAARSGTGLGLMALAGGAAGWVFARLARPDAA